MASTWYIVANRTDAVFYVDGRDHKFHFIDRLTNPLGSASEAELDSSGPGRGISSAEGTIRHGLDRTFQHHEGTAREFARRIAAGLRDAHLQGRFEGLVLAAEPHFLGLLRGAMDERTQAAIRHEIRREYAQGSDSEVRARILHAIELER